MSGKKTYYNLCIFKYLNFTRLLNVVQVSVSFSLAVLFRRAIHWGFPVSISVEPANICNLNCPECPAGKKELSRDKGLISFSLFKNIIDQVYPKTFYLTLYFQGEPYLHDEFFDMVKYAVGKKMFVSTSTNAHFLYDENAKKTVESGLSRIIISIDGTTQEAYEKYRIGGSFDKVTEGIRNIIRWRRELKSKTPEVILQFLVMRHNEHQLADIKKLAKELGSDKLMLKTAQIYNYVKGNEFIPLNEKYSRYKKTTDGKYRIKNKLRNRCLRLWMSGVFTHDGFLLPCCFDKDAQHWVGNIDHQPFDKIWKGEELKKFRLQVLKRRKEIDICCNCTEGMSPWV